MTTVDRRTFLKAAGSGVGTLALTGDTPLAATPAARPAQRAVAAANSEIVVVGAGAFGGWTALYLREMGLTVTLVDQYGPGNSRATSGGESRQIRAGYGERELYTRWVLQAFDRWQAREAEWGKKLFYRTGQLSLATEWTKEQVRDETVDLVVSQRPWGIGRHRAANVVEHRRRIRPVAADGFRRSWIAREGKRVARQPADQDVVRPFLPRFAVASCTARRVNRCALRRRAASGRESHAIRSDVDVPCGDLRAPTVRADGLPEQIPRERRLRPAPGLG